MWREAPGKFYAPRIPLNTSYLQDPKIFSFAGPNVTGYSTFIFRLRHRHRLIPYA